MTIKLTSTLALALLAVMAGCEGGTYPAPESQEVIDDSIAIATDIPIRLGVCGTATVVSRAGGAGVIDDAFANTDVGLFCISTAHLSAAGIVPAWQEDADGTPSKTVWWSNVRGTANTVADGTNSLMWNGGIAASDVRNYYPFSNYAYSFYAYHPFQTSPDNVTITDTQVSVSFTLDGTDDVLWARATPAQATDGLAAYAFSSYYYRHGGSAIPTFSFQHKLVRLKVTVTPPTGITPENLQVTFLGLPAKATLVVAAKDADEEGMLTADWTATTDYTLPASGELLLPCPEAPNDTLNVRITYGYRPYATSNDVTTVTVNRKVFLPEGSTWQAGYKYNVDIQVDK